MRVDDVEEPSILKYYRENGIYDYKWDKTNLKTYVDAEHLTHHGSIRVFPNLKPTRQPDYDGMLLMGLGDEDFTYANAEPHRGASVIGAMKYNKPNPKPGVYYQKCIAQAVGWYSTAFKHEVENCTYTPLTTCIEKLDHSTSPGLPWTSMGYKDKTSFHEDRGYGDYVAYYETHVFEIEGPTILITSALKEEVRAKAKLALGRIRQINAVPTHFSAALNTYRLSQSEALTESHTRTESAVGMSVMHGGWNALYRKLSVFEEGYDGDFKEYDSSQLAWLMWVEAIMSWEHIAQSNNWIRGTDEYEVHLRRYLILTEEEINSLLLTVTGDLLQKWLGNISGTPITTTRNTRILWLVMAAAWFSYIVSKQSDSGRGGTPPGLVTLEGFQLSVRAALYGDDQTFSVTPEHIGGYSGKFLQDFSGALGMTLEIDFLPKRVISLPFLSKCFHVVGGYAYGIPLDVEKYQAGLFRRDSGNVVFRFARLCAYRLECAPSMLINDVGEYGCCRSIYLQADKCCKALYQRYDGVMQTDPTWVSVRGAYKDLNQLLSVHRDYESKWDVPALVENYLEAGTLAFKTDNEW